MATIAVLLALLLDQTEPLQGPQASNDGWLRQRLRLKACNKRRLQQQGNPQPLRATTQPALYLRLAAYLGHSGRLLASSLVLLVTGQNDHFRLLGAIAQLQQDPAL